jgi:hypothetical protein
VGYRSLQFYDRTRPSIGDLARGVNPIAGHGRPMHVHLWYPATGRTGNALAFGEYISQLRNIILQPGKGRTSDELFLEQPTDLGADRKLLEFTLPQLKALAVLARSDAKPVAGRFPLVIFPDYRAPSTNSVLCEYIASHGYVVASYAMKGTYDLPYNTGRSGIETGAEDIAFVRAELGKIPGVDLQRTAVMGVGIEASSALLAAMRNPEISALISLEGGIPTAFEDGLLKRIPSFDPAMFRAPLLAIYVDEEGPVDPAFFDQYKYSERHLIDFKHMREFFFLNYGTLDAIVPGIIGKPPGNTVLGVRLAGEYIVRFLEAYLRDSAAARRDLASAPEVLGIAPGNVSVHHRAALPEPKAYHELRAMIGRDFSEFRGWYEEARKSDPQPISMSSAAELSGWLAYAGDSDGSKRLELARMRVEMYPQSARAHFALAQQLKNRQLPDARVHFQTALEMLPADQDLSLDDSLRQRIKDLAARELK